MPAVNPENQVASLDIGDSQLELSWHDGYVSRYPASWLLEACDCDTCGDTRSAVRHTRLVDKPQRPAILIATHDTDSVRIDWGNGHLSCYSLPWLRYHCLSPAGRAKRKFKPSCWGDEMATNLPYMDYTEVAASDDLQLQFLESILHKGFAVLRGVPAARERTEEITSLVGKLRLTNYEVYELESKPVPEIVGDMSLALAPHTDEPYRVDPPAITFFHVIAQSRDGGASTLVGVEYTEFSAREASEADQKARIARACAEMIPNDVALMINSGTTTAAVARALDSHTGLRIVTDSVKISHDIRGIKGAEVMVPGGRVRPSDGAILGHQAIEFISQFRPDFAVIGAAAIATRLAPRSRPRHRTAACGKDAALSVLHDCTPASAPRCKGQTKPRPLQRHA